MKVTGIKGKRDYIDVYFGEKVVRIYGELVIGGFIAAANTIKQWKIPEGEPISEAEKKEIMDAVIEKTKGSHLTITFE